MSRSPDTRSADPQQMIADLQRQLDERTAERDALRRQLADSIEQQTATVEVLGIINSSPGNLSPVFDAMVEKAIRLCEAACGHLLTYDGEHVTPAAVRGTPEYTEYMRSVGLVPPGIDTPVGRALRGEAVVHIADAREEEIYRSNEGFREQADRAGFRSMLVVGLRREHTFLGTLTVFRQEVRPFTDKHIALLQNFAEQAVIAMHNAQLLTETREALDQQTATAEVLQVINSSPGDLEPVFDAALEKAMQVCDAAYGTLWTYNGTYFHLAALRGVPAKFAEFLRRMTAEEAMTPTHARVLAGEEVAHVHDAAADEGYYSGNPQRRALVELGGARTLLTVPLRKGATVRGVFTIYRQQVRPFSARQIPLLQNFAGQAVIAMENARLLTETREALEQQTATAEVLQVINSSPGDLAPVFDAMLERALASCGGNYGALLTFDGERFHPVCKRRRENPSLKRPDRPASPE
jgi:GAF domain-containing protein